MNDRPIISYMKPTRNKQKNHDLCCRGTEAQTPLTTTRALGLPALEGGRPLLQVCNQFVENCRLIELGALVVLQTVCVGRIVSALKHSPSFCMRFLLVRPRPCRSFSQLSLSMIDKTITAKLFDCLLWLGELLDHYRTISPTVPALRLNKNHGRIKRLDCLLWLGKLLDRYRIIHPTVTAYRFNGKPKQNYSPQNGLKIAPTVHALHSLPTLQFLLISTHWQRTHEPCSCLIHD